MQPEFNPFQDDYLSDILETATVAWNRMRQPLATELEDQLTFRLAGRIANDVYFADFPYDVVPQYWLLGLHGQRLGRLDLRFKHRYSQRDYFACEAKRLRVKYPGGSFSTEYSTYAGEDGMMAFVQGQYSRGLPACGMISYVMDGNCDKAWNGLSIRMERRRAQLKLAYSSKLDKSALSGSIAQGMQGTRLGETEHILGNID